jgi:hypothetical protein
MAMSRGVVPHDEGTRGEWKEEKRCHAPIDSDQVDGGDRNADAGDRSREREQQRAPGRDILVSLRLGDSNADGGLGQRGQPNRDERGDPSQWPPQILETGDREKDRGGNDDGGGQRDEAEQAVPQRALEQQERRPGAEDLGGDEPERSQEEEAECERCGVR